MRHQRGLNYNETPIDIKINSEMTTIGVKAALLFL